MSITVSWVLYLYFRDLNHAREYQRVSEGKMIYHKNDCEMNEFSSPCLVGGCSILSTDHSKNKQKTGIDKRNAHLTYSILIFYLVQYIFTFKRIGP